MIRLGQLLKLSGVAEDGVHAKEILGTERVLVNGGDDNRRGRQLVVGDVVTIVGHEQLRVVASDD